MSPAKRFLLITAGVSLLVWMAGVWMWGPPEYTAQYMEQFKHEHDHYIEVVKSEAYKRYKQRPHLNGPDSSHAPEHFAEQLAFVKHYESMPEFQAEQTRRHRFEQFFSVFNALLLIVIVVYFGKAPFIRMLDAKAAETRESLDAAERAKAQAQELLGQVQEKLNDFGSLREKIDEDTRARIAHELAQLDKLHAKSKEHCERELADRHALADRRAVLRVKRELADLTMERLEAKARAASVERQNAWIDEFCIDVERLA